MRSKGLSLCIVIEFVALLLASAALAETQDEITQALMRSDPKLRALILSHPSMPEGWRESFWADALLRAPTYPGDRWRVDDLRRPQPPLRQPDTKVCARPAPKGAVVLLDGDGPVGFTGDQLSIWRPHDGIITTSGVQASRLPSRDAFGDLSMHLEFRMPSPPTGVGQYRGNSGVFLMGLYEVQILDSFDNPTYADGAMGALYGQVPPRFIANRPPGEWQCLDIDFKAPVFGSGALISPARASVWVNRVRVQADAAFRGPTTFAALSTYQPHAARLPLTLQDHADAGGVSFRNIWVLPRDHR